MGLFSKKPQPRQVEPKQSALSATWSKAPGSETYTLPDLFHKTPRLDSVDLIAGTIADSPLQLFNAVELRNDPDEAVPIREHALLNLFETPCPAFPELDGYALKYLTVVLSELLGEMFWLKIRDGRKITEILPFPPAWCTSTPTSGDPAFSFNPFGVTAGKPFRVAPADVVWFKMPNAFDPFARGRGRTEAMGDELDTDEMAAKWQKNYFYNDGTPPFIVTIPGATSADIERARETWASKVGGWLNARKPQFIGGNGATVSKLTDTNREMEFVESRRYLRDSFLQHYSIPPELFGIIENSNRSTIDAAFYLFAKNVISRRLGFYERAITNQLVKPDFDALLAVKFNFVVPEDKSFKLEVANAGVQAGTITRAEWRKSMGYKVEPGDDVFILPMSMVETPRGQPKEAPAPAGGIGLSIVPEKPEEPEEPEDPEDPEPTKAVKTTESRLDAVWKAFDTKAREGEGMFRARVRAFAAEQKKRVDRIIKANPLQADTAIDEAFNDRADEALMHSLAPAWLSSMTDGADHGRAVMMRKAAPSFDLYNLLFDAWVKMHGLKKAKEINETTHDELRGRLSDELAKGIQEGEGIEGLADRLLAACEGVYGNMSGYRAELIARTETIGTVNYGSMATYKAEGATKKEWLASPGGSAAAVREDHQVGSGYGEPYVVGIDEAFVIGGEALQYPGDPAGSAGNVCNCRCALLPVVE